MTRTELVEHLANGIMESTESFDDLDGNLDHEMTALAQEVGDKVYALARKQWPVAATAHEPRTLEHCLVMQIGKEGFYMSFQGVARGNVRQSIREAACCLKAKVKAPLQRIDERIIGGIICEGHENDNRIRLFWSTRQDMADNWAREIPGEVSMPLNEEEFDFFLEQLDFEPNIFRSQQ